VSAPLGALFRSIGPRVNRFGEVFVGRSVAILGTRGYPSYYGGFETAVRKIAPALADRGWNVTVYGRRGATREDDPTRDARIRQVITGGIESRSLSTLSYGFTSALHALRTKPDVALVMNVANGFWLPLLKWRGIPTVVNVDGTEWIRAKWGRLARALFMAGARLTARYATTVVFDSLAIADVWKEMFDRDGVFIPYGGDVPDGELPIEEGLTHRGYVLVVARLVPENSIAEFLGAATSLASTHDVVIVGSSRYGGDLDRAVEELASNHHRVRWLGSVADDDRLLSLWQHAGVYFHGHSVGGTNPALVQAMTCGAPIVARDTVFNREVLADAGVLVEAIPEEIAAAVAAILNDPARAERLSRAARDRALKDYAWDGVCEAYGDALEAAGSDVR
jgi:glycosyltransferase involved in cell wall biosynthesis